MSSPGGLVISGLGMVSNLGFTVEATCAAQRTGVVRRHPLLDYVAYDESTLEAPVSGAPIRGFTDGFIQAGAWVRLGLAALEDLVRYGHLPDRNARAFWSKTGLAWVLPALQFERFLWPEPEVPALLERHCGALLADLAQLSLHMIPGGFFTSGPMGVAAAMRRAEALLAEGTLERVIILGTDSWMDPLSMG
ncbi:hypothetical protein KRR26_31635 [Corallococcus sp. M34]|uniref:hypothetical protein n=1 Tax=Citreicoccus inhibens TaxID=2849499 RepID=UPI001C2485A2|nr:hypothetical protein [Citreicoccus inhibens]MBU8900168.1 hypothetical protein [Citreicoccus inhibens]